MKTNFIVCCIFALLIAYPAQAAENHRASRHKSVATEDSESPASASDANHLGFQFGPQITSGNLSESAGNNVPDTDSRTRLNFGIFLEHNLNPNFAIRPELNYSQMGYSINQPAKPGAAANTAVTADVSADFLQLPVLVKAQMPLQGFTPYAVTGPALGVMMGKDMTVTANNQVTHPSLDGKTNSFAFGWVFGAGSTIPLTKTVSMDASIRYNLGLTNSESDAAEGESAKLSAFQILAGISMAI